MAHKIQIIVSNPQETTQIKVAVRAKPTDTEAEARMHNILKSIGQQTPQKQ